MLFNKMLCFRANSFISQAQKFSSSSVHAKRLVEHVEGDTITVGLEEIPESGTTRYFRQESTFTEKKGCKCALCSIPVKISYSDVLILEQFMRKDGTVLPRDFTGLCEAQQRCLERCVMQAHWSHLFPDRSIAGFDLSGYKRFQRHWDDDLSMEKTFIKVYPGSWYYIKRYNPKKNEYKRMPNA